MLALIRLQPVIPHVLHGVVDADSEPDEQREVAGENEKNVSPHVEDRYCDRSEVPHQQQKVEQSHDHHCDSKSVHAETDFLRLIILHLVTDDGNPK